MLYKQNSVIILLGLIVLAFSALTLTLEAKTDNTNNLAQSYLSEKSHSSSALSAFLTEEDRVEDKNEKKYTKIKVILTAYSSTVWQTDDTPFITANGSTVREGIVANNMLPFGTEIKIPELYGNRVFTVEDRMHSRKGSYWVDIWFPTLEEAKAFGVKEAYVEVLEI
jgi:3D (Asp-Asp-Asp) domain-containing protein